MLKRTKILDLQNWAGKKNRKPLILRGARQVGKTTLINMFSKDFNQYIYLNLDKPEEKKLFSNEKNADEIIRSIFYLKSCSITDTKTLVFIDEIQNSPVAIKILRYFYEDFPHLYVITAGSLLESLLNFQESFPVGRVEIEYLFPLSFAEYLLASGKQGLKEAMEQIPFPELLNPQMMKTFSEYALIGGMPEIVNHFLSNKDIILVNQIFESLLVSYLDDVEKYAKNINWSNILRHVIKTCFANAGGVVKFEGFGNSSYRNREIKEALSLIQKTMLIKLIRRTHSTTLPISVIEYKAPKLLLLDNGLVNYFAGVQKEFFMDNKLEDIFMGRIAEQLVGQEILRLKNSQIFPLTYWTKERPQSTAEVDYVYQFENLLIPIEVKSGKAGRLRSLMQFVDSAPHNFAVRIYSENLSLEKARTLNGKEFLLLNLPIFLTGKLEEYIRWMISHN